MLLRVADDFGFKIRTLQHVLEGYKVAKEIAAHGAGASTFSDWWAYKVEAYDAIPYNAAIMTAQRRAGFAEQRFAELMRHLNDEAAKTMKYGGLTETEALSMITINPAKQLMIDNRVGSIEVGKDADLVIFDKHPLSNYAKVEKVFIDGQDVFRSRSGLGRAAGAKRQRRKAVDKEKEQQKKAAAPRRTAVDEDLSHSYYWSQPARYWRPPTTRFLIRGATVHPVSGPEIQNGSVLVRDGKIVGRRPQSRRAERRPHHRRQGHACLSRHDRFGHRARPLGNRRGPRERRHRRAGQVQSAASR